MKRREFITLLGGAAAGLSPAWPSQRARAQTAKGGGRGPTVAEDIARWVVELRYEELPPNAIARAKRVLLDTIGCALGAIGAEPVQMAQRVVAMQGGNPQATILGIGRKVSCDQAAEAMIEVPFAVGSKDLPAGLVFATEERPRGPEGIVDAWSEALIAFAWRLMLTVAIRIAAQSGVDEDGAGLVPIALTAAVRTRAQALGLSSRTMMSSRTPDSARRGISATPTPAATNPRIAG